MKRRRDLINAYFYDELLLQIFKRIEKKRDRDALSLVCRQWLALERISRTSLPIGAVGRPYLYVDFFPPRFPNISCLKIDERYAFFRPTQGSSHILRRYSVLRLQLMKRSLEFQYHFSDYELEAFANAFTRLEKLSIIWCSNVSCKGLVSLAEKCRSLKSLDLKGCYIGDLGLFAVGQCCKQLEDLNLQDCEGKTDRGFIEIATECGKSLKLLTVAACGKVTDASLEALGRHCKSLQTVSLDSDFINSEGISSMVQGCPLLKTLMLKCINIIDKALIEVGQCCSLLRELVLHSL